MISKACLCTREDVMRATDVKETARNAGQIDRAIEAATDSVVSLCQRDFIPWHGTRYFDWPDPNRSRSFRLWLGRNEVVSVSELTIDGTATTSYFLRRADGRTEPPYTYIELDLSGSASFVSGQREIGVTGVFAHSANSSSAATLNGSINAAATTLAVSDSSGIGVGDGLLIDGERLTVTAKTMADTGVNIDAGDSLTAAQNDVSITMSTTTGAPTVDEVILIGSERMLVIDVAGLTLTVKRAWDGSTLAAHSGGADIYAPRTLAVLRGSQGTTAASHNSSATVYRHGVPGLIRELAVAEAVNFGAQEKAEWARTSGSGDNEREFNGRALSVLRQQALTAYGRQARKRAV